MRSHAERGNEGGVCASAAPRPRVLLSFETALMADYVNPALLADDPDRPLSAWWWHLGKLRQRTYPAALLPTYLQSIYRQDASKAA